MAEIVTGENGTLSIDIAVLTNGQLQVVSVPISQSGEFYSLNINQISEPMLSNLRGDQEVLDVFGIDASTAQKLITPEDLTIAIDTISDLEEHRVAQAEEQQAAAVPQVNVFNELPSASTPLDQGGDRWRDLLGEREDAGEILGTEDLTQALAAILNTMNVTTNQHGNTLGEQIVGAATALAQGDSPINAALENGSDYLQPEVNEAFAGLSHLSEQERAALAELVATDVVDGALDQLTTFIEQNREAVGLAEGQDVTLLVGAFAEAVRSQTPQVGG